MDRLSSSDSTACKASTPAHISMGFAVIHRYDPGRTNYFWGKDFRLNRRWVFLETFYSPSQSVFQDLIVVIPHVVRGKLYIVSAERQDHFTWRAFGHYLVFMEEQISRKHCFVEMLDTPLQDFVEKKRLEGFDVESELLWRNRLKNRKEKIGRLGREFVALSREIVESIAIYRLKW